MGKGKGVVTSQNLIIKTLEYKPLMVCNKHYYTNTIVDTRQVVALL